MAWSLVGEVWLMGALGVLTASESPAKVGDTYEITSDRESSTQGPNGSAGSTSDVDALVERVLAVRTDGLELEYDLARNASADDQRSQWQLPARVFRPFAGSPQLLNRAELEQRVDPWLKAGGMTRAACNHLIFTWNVFRIDCDPQSALRIIDAFDLRSPDLHDGTSYMVAGGKGPARLSRTSLGSDGATYVAVAEIDREVVRRTQAETDVSVGELTRKAVSLDAALRTHATDRISGTINVTLETDAGGQVRQRTKVTKYSVTSAKGTKIVTTTETLKRQRLS